MNTQAAVGYKALFTHSTYAFHMQEWFNVARNDGLQC